MGTTMRMESPLTFVFDSREDVVREIIQGQHAHHLRGFECTSDGRIVVRVDTPKLTPFSAHVRVRDGVTVDADTDWRKWMQRPDDLNVAPPCAGCGSAMRPLQGSPWLPPEAASNP
jgi:hypothetical protein